MDLRIFFHGLRENTCSSQPALKNTAPGLQNPAAIIWTIVICFVCSMFAPIAIAVGDRMFLGMQDFNFAQI